MTGTYLIGVSMCLVGLGIRMIYELLKKTDKIDTEDKRIFLTVFLAMCLLLISWPIMCCWDPERFALPGVVRGLGLVLFISGSGLALGALIQLRGVENIDRLVTTGLFSRFRHPMYSGFILWITGWVIYYGAIFSSILGLISIGSVLLWRRFEEENLISRYGAVYETYRKSTWF